MRVEDLMILGVRTCSPDDDLNRVAQLMWEGDCGAIPVVDVEGCAVGMITDRDVAMAAYTKGMALSSIRVRDAMAREVFGCSPKDSIESAMGVMQRWRVRRLPVLDRHRRLVGIVSLHDVVREAERERRAGAPQLSATDIVKTLSTVCRPWSEPAPRVSPMSDPKRSEPRIGSVSARQSDVEC